jgi:hypothetical protein
LKLFTEMGNKWSVSSLVMILTGFEVMGSFGVSSNLIGVITVSSDETLTQAGEPQGNPPSRCLGFITASLSL